MVPSCIYESRCHLTRDRPWHFCARVPDHLLAIHVGGESTAVILQQCYSLERFHISQGLMFSIYLGNVFHFNLCIMDILGRVVVKSRPVLVIILIHFLLQCLVISSSGFHQQDSRGENLRLGGVYPWWYKTNQERYQGDARLTLYCYNLLGYDNPHALTA